MVFDGKNIVDMSESAISLVYFDQVNNAGDLCSPEIVSRILQRDVKKCIDRLSPHLLGVGSIMSMANANSFIWGSGIIDPNIGFGDPDAQKIFAVRGKLTLDVMKRGNVDNLTKVALGDPAVLLPGLLRVTRQSTPIHRFGLIPHYIDEDCPHIRRLVNQEGVKIISVGLNLIDFLKEISCCEYIASTSLHGLVFAESLGVPNVWIRSSDNIVGGNFKYLDWFSLARFPQSEPIYMSPQICSQDLISKAIIHEVAICKQDLVDTLLEIGASL